ncbi:MAG TPA: HAD hydrolase family protein [Steroidobacteraceae bacterium]|jgi:3-deoxy-D-manno-octulosonate 8-phosphate phosphatase (KDO 8-P phosphatase)|nr:HAD hydrolase family protein [Steroidobacteraceae bacterium]
MPRRASPRSAPLARIRLLVLDVDGVMTDGRLYFGADGELAKSFCVRDGYGIKAVLAAGIAVAVISGRRSAAVQRRCEELGIEQLHQGVEDKAAQFRRLTRALAIAPRQCACVGDDLPDVPLMSQAGLAVAVADAHPAALAVAHRRTRAPGGHGAVREVCDWLLAARGSGRRAQRGRRAP